MSKLENLVKGLLGSLLDVRSFEANLKTHSSSFDVRKKITFEFVPCSMKWCSTHN